MGPKKSQPPLEGKIFIVHPFNWAALWVSPPKNNYIPQHLQNGYINSYCGSMVGLDLLPVLGLFIKKNIRIHNRCGSILKRSSDSSFDVTCPFDEVAVLANKTKKS